MILRPYQETSLIRIEEEWRNCNRTLLVLPTGCHMRGQKVIMANGDFETVENIKVGDELLGVDSTPRRVIKLHHGSEQMAKISPVKGDPFVVNINHILSLKETGTESIINISVKDYLEKSNNFKHLHKLYRSKGVEFAEKDGITIDPYFLGLLLGDGCIINNISISNPDPEIALSIYCEAQKHSMNVRVQDKDSDKCITYFLTNSESHGCKGGSNPYINMLREMGLYGCKSGEKFIPGPYKCSPKQHRLRILAGILDTDGHLSHGNTFDYVTKSEQLIDDVIFICRSLGLSAYKKEKFVNGDVFYRTCISGDLEQIPTRVARKKASPRQQKKSVTVTGFSVELLPEDDFYGFTIDGDHLYHLDDFTITHNCGKTIVFTKLAEKLVREGKRVLILAHREELIFQAADKLKQATGLDCAIEKAEQTALDSFFMITVGSVQSLSNQKRLERFSPDHYDVIIVDEAHHILSPTYQRVIEYFSGAKLLGVTATPDRGDKKNLGKVFESIAYEYSLHEAIQSGYLSRINAVTIPLEINLNNIGVQAGDFKAGDLDDALMPYMESIADEMLTYCKDRKTIVFLPLIATSQKMTDLLNQRGFRAAEINGMSKDRKEVLADFHNDKYNVICNSMLLCLDMETEILTQRGFLKYHEMKQDDLVANWCDDGSVFFEKPKEIVCRDLYKDREHMVSIESKTINLRVTSTHRMLVGGGVKNRCWRKIPAKDLKSGHVLPSCGISKPKKIKIEDEYSSIELKRRISANSYNLRKKGLSFQDSIEEAKKRISERDSLRFLQPEELTNDHCKLIGFWIADGSKSILQSGGVEYTLCQSHSYPKIISWIDKLIKSLGYDYIKREKKSSDIKANNYVVWSFPRGTGFGIQKKYGFYEIEPYLNKNGSDFFHGLNESQFDALVEGYWMGDGWHGKDADFSNASAIIANDTNRNWIDLLQTLGVVRGWRSNVTYLPSKKENHNDQWRITMVKGRNYHISNKTKINHEPYKKEKVWCVKTTSKNIITRRGGKVTVMGNTEGFDEPSVDCIVCLRPTKVRALYCQIVGRGTRLFEGKDNLLVLDFLWHTEKHELCRPAHLVASNQEVAKKAQEIMEAKAGGQLEFDMIELEEMAKTEVTRDREKALADRLAEMKKRARKFVDPLQFALSICSEDLSHYEPVMPHEMGPPSKKQLEFIERSGINPDEVTCAGYASKLIDRINNRRTLGLATPKQVRMLERKGFNHVGEWKFQHANEMITAIATNNWRVPPGINPSTYDYKYEHREVQNVPF